MRSPWFPGLIASLLLIVLLLASAPARLVAQWVPAEQLVLQGVRGTVWNGEAVRAMVATGNGWLHLGQLRWQLSPLSLFTLSPRITLASEWGRQQLNARLRLQSSDNMELTAVEAVIDAAVLRQYLPVSLVGSLAIQFERLVIEAGLPREAQGRLVWRDAGWLSPQGRRGLGSYAVDISTGPGKVLVGNVVTLAGEVNAQGELTLRSGEYQVNVLLTGSGLGDPQLRQALQLVAAPEGEGYRVAMQGEL